MTMRWKAIACAVTLGVAAVVAASAQTPTTADQTLDGTYSADQARRGRAVYDSKCASCHDGGTMGPELWGDPFLAQWDGKSLATFFTRIQTTMPEEAPGTLREREVLDVIAYLLQTNGFRAGEKDIASASALEPLKFTSEKQL
jgi:mono/diheme cytochrome c family protein